MPVVAKVALEDFNRFGWINLGTLTNSKVLDAALFEVNPHLLDRHFLEGSQCPLDVIDRHACNMCNACIISQHFSLLFFTFMLVCAHAAVYG